MKDKVDRVMIVIFTFVFGVVVPLVASTALSIAAPKPQASHSAAAPEPSFGELVVLGLVLCGSVLPAIYSVLTALP